MTDLFYYRGSENAVSRTGGSQEYVEQLKRQKHLTVLKSSQKLGCLRTLKVAQDGICKHLKSNNCLMHLKTDSQREQKKYNECLNMGYL